MGRKPDDRVEGVTVENYTNSSVSVTKVCIENEKGAETIGKPIGNYVTLECEKLRTGDEQALSETRETLTYELGELADLNDDSIVLVVGLTSHATCFRKCRTPWAMTCAVCVQ